MESNITVFTAVLKKRSITLFQAVLKTKRVCSTVILYLMWKRFLLFNDGKLALIDWFLEHLWI